MQTIRRGVFETNSSSTHSITICSREDYDMWRKGDMVYNTYKGDGPEFMPLGEAKELLKSKGVVIDYDNVDELNQALSDFDLYTYTRYMNYSYNDELEIYVENCTTKGGEKIVAFGKYGYDG